MEYRESRRSNQLNGEEGGYIWPAKWNLTVQNAPKYSPQSDLPGLDRPLWPAGLVRPSPDHSGHNFRAHTNPAGLSLARGRTILAGTAPHTKNIAIFTFELRFWWTWVRWNHKKYIYNIMQRTIIVQSWRII
jgi:hypothetical protein